MVKKYLLSKNRKSTLPARAWLALPASGTCGGGCSPGAALAPQASALQPRPLQGPSTPPGLLGLQELGLHPGHLTEVLGVCPRALHLTPADGHHLHP